MNTGTNNVAETIHNIERIICIPEKKALPNLLCVRSSVVQICPGLELHLEMTVSTITPIQT